MIRTLVYFVLLAVFIAIALWAADWNGSVVFDLPAYSINLHWWQISWNGYEVVAPIAVVILAVALVAAVIAFLYRIWVAIMGAPKSLGRRAQESKRHRGYKALSQGMAAVAAGDGPEARKLARKAENLLDDPPLTLLLSAQAAQLGGDDQAAQRYFEAMLEREETRFMGLRGLVMQALRDGDRSTALRYLRQAHALRPKTPWVLTSMVELAEADGDFATAEQAIKDAVRAKALPAPEGGRKRAIVLLERAEALEVEGDRRQAIKLAREAHKVAPALVPATARLARLLIANGKGGEAARLLERAWAEAPHPELAKIYQAAKPAGDGLKSLTKMRRLVSGAPENPTSLVVLAEAALEAELWGEARRYLTQAGGEAPNEPVCRLMARLEEAEHGDGEKARAWLVKAARAPRGPVWTCEACGAEAEAWSPHCGHCDAFATIAWRPPRRVGPTSLATAAPTAVIEAKPNGGNGAPTATNGNGGGNGNGAQNGNGETKEPEPLRAAAGR
ncbi:MAG: heme biosynthesis HemY N-terminal domain-containing protein [Pseudomonadota bacterium]